MGKGVADDCAEEACATRWAVRPKIWQLGVKGSMFGVPLSTMRNVRTTRKKRRKDLEKDHSKESDSVVCTVGACCNGGGSAK